MSECEVVVSPPRAAGFLFQTENAKRVAFSNLTPTFTFVVAWLIGEGGATPPEKFGHWRRNCWVRVQLRWNDVTPPALAFDGLIRVVREYDNRSADKSKQLRVKWPNGLLLTKKVREARKVSHVGRCRKMDGFPIANFVGR